MLVEVNRDFIKALNGEKEAETTGEDNLKTMRLVYAAYESAANNSIVEIKGEVYSYGKSTSIKGK